MNATRNQFSLRRLLFIVTAICVFLAIPGGYYLLTSIGSLLLTGAAVIAAVLVLQVPTYFVLRRLTERPSK